ncbi:MAG: hypothetical protein LBG48_01860 [Rickettsiales bacterium]|jgi:hypothetical protein|nr:hypothetical protein [Rickettsiales bacterium]
MKRPIILFGQPQNAEKSKRGGRAPSFHYPFHSRQIDRLSPIIDVLKNAVADMQKTTVGIESEKTLVFDVVGSVDNFYTAVKNLGNDDELITVKKLDSNAELIFDMPTEFDASDDFYVIKTNENTKKEFRNENKNLISGRVYCVISNVRALNHLLSLWEDYKKKSDNFPKKMKGLKKVFKQLNGI